jgi:hypothetical protein
VGASDADDSRRCLPRAAVADGSSFFVPCVLVFSPGLEPKENLEKARLRVETALAIARQEFDKRFGALDDATREAMLRVIESGYAPEKYDEQLLDCPACSSPALVSGSVRTDLDEDWDHHEGALVAVHAYFMFIPSHLRCSACGLELDGRDELDAAGIEEPWVLENVDERDFFGGDEAW